MKRSNAREIAVHLLYEHTKNNISAEEMFRIHFNDVYYQTLKEESDVYAELPDDSQLDYIRKVVCGVIDNEQKLDAIIAEYAKGWNLHRISALAKVIMRLSIFECLEVSDVPQNASISEAVALAKKYEDESTVPFINGILGSFSRASSESKNFSSEGAEL